MSKRITKYTEKYWINRGLNIEESIEKIKEFKLKQRKNNPNCLEYWIFKGYSEKDAKIKRSEIQKNNSNKRKNKLTPSQESFWIKYKGFSLEEAKNAVKKNIEKTNPYKKESWLYRGYSEEEAIKKIRKIQSQNSKKVKERKNGRTIKKYLDLGFNEVNAKKELFNIQRVGALDNFIERYGEEEGKKRWEGRQIQWKKTINSRFSKLEQRNWCSFTYEDCIIKYGKEKGDQWLKNKIQKGYTYSKISFKLFEEISKRISGDFYFGKKEYVLKRSKWTYIVDFYDNDTKKVIEFNGDLWHANPLFYNENDIVNPFSKETAKEIWKRDIERIENISNLVDGILIIWEFDYKKNSEKIIKECIDFLKT